MLWYRHETLFSGNIDNRSVYGAYIAAREKRDVITLRVNGSHFLAKNRFKKTRLLF